MPPQTPLPSEIILAALRVMPPALLARLLPIVTRRLEAAYPRLFERLGALKPAVIHVEITDLPRHGFALTLGPSAQRISLLGLFPPEPDARVRGSLKSLLDLVEGRIDSDTLFFTRALTMTGDTEAVVALRNTLDREPLDTLGAVAALAGPFAGPARQVLAFVGERARKVKDHLAEVHGTLHRADEGQAREQAALNERLRTELDDLRTRLAKLEGRQRRKESATA